MNIHEADIIIRVKVRNIDHEDDLTIVAETMAEGAMGAIMEKRYPSLEYLRVEFESSIDLFPKEKGENS